MMRQRVATTESPGVVGGPLSRRRYPRWHAADNSVTVQRVPETEVETLRRITGWTLLALGAALVMGLASQPRVWQGGILLAVVLIAAGLALVYRPRRRTAR